MKKAASRTYQVVDATPRLRFTWAMKAGTLACQGNRTGSLGWLGAILRLHHQVQPKKANVLYGFR
jgi:hypothetical protein